MSLDLSKFEITTIVAPISCNVIHEGYITHVSYDENGKPKVEEITIEQWNKLYSAK